MFDAVMRHLERWARLRGARVRGDLPEEPAQVRRATPLSAGPHCRSICGARRATGPSCGRWSGTARYLHVANLAEPADFDDDLRDLLTEAYDEAAS